MKEASIQRADDGTTNDVAQIMNTEIHARIAHKASPKNHSDREAPIAEDKRHVNGKSEGVGGMTRREAVSTPTIAVDNMYERRERVVEIGWTKPLELGTYQRSTGLVGSEDDKTDGHQAQGCPLPRHTTEEEIRKKYVEGNPHPAVADEPHHAIEERTVRIVDNEQQTFIYMNEPQQESF